MFKFIFAANCRVFEYPTGFYNERDLCKSKKAKLNFYDVLKEVESANARIIMSIGDSETTDIDNLCDDTDNDTNYIDMKGRKMKRPSKGVYLKDGKKYVK